MASNSEMEKMLDDLQRRLDEQDRQLKGPVTDQRAILGGDMSSAAPVSQGGMQSPQMAQLDAMGRQATDFGGPATYPGKAPPPTVGQLDQVGQEATAFGPPAQMPTLQQPPFPPQTRPEDREGLDAYARMMGMLR